MRRRRPGGAPGGTIERTTGGHALVQSLLQAGVDVAFGMPGGDNLPIYDALLESPALRHVLVRHEQGAGFMADGYARATRRVGVCITTTGPGALNATTALAAAHADGSPVLLISSQTESALIGRGKGPSHDMKDQLGVFKSIANSARRVDSVAAIPAAVHRAIRATQGPRPGPAYLEIPADVLAATAEVQYPRWRARRGPRPSLGAIRRVAEHLAASRRPVLLVGGGIRWSGAWCELIELAERVGAPVVTTMAGKGAIPETHPLSFGLSWGRWRAAADLLAEADLVVAIGTRLGAMDTAHWTLPLPERVIHIDLDASQIGRNYTTTLAVVGDARESLRTLLDVMRDTGSADRHPWLHLGDFRDRALAIIRGSFELALVNTLSQALPESVMIMNDAPALGYWVMAFWPARTPDAFLTAGFGSLGFGLPAALGARAGLPDRPILVLCGDGGLLFSGQELATTVRERLPVVVLVVNDDSYGSVRIIQEQRYRGRTSQVNLTNPDFVTFAESFGIPARRLTDPAETGPALAAAFAAGGPCLIELPIHCGLPPLS